MEIVIPEQGHPLGLKWFRGMSRYDTMTDSHFLDESTVICANREAGKFYIVDFSLQPSYAKVVFSIDTVFDGVFKYVDLFTICDNYLYFVSLDNTIGIYKIENKTLIKQELITVPAKYYFHSITFHPTKENIVYLGSALFNPCLVVYNLQSRTVLEHIVLKNLESYLIKDVKFVNEELIAVSGTGGLISPTNKQHSYNSKLGLYNSETFEYIDSFPLPTTHTDGICVDENNIVYLVAQSDSPTNILRFKIENSKLKQILGFQVPQFPHGINIKYGKFTCSSLKNSSIFVSEIANM